MEIGIIGADGFIGSNLVKELRECHKVYPITKKNYNNSIKIKYDILINANGNSKKFLAESNPLLDFDLSVKSVYSSLMEFYFKVYIYISSIDVYGGTIYGFHKKLAEDIIKKLSSKKNFNYVNLRCGSVIGLGMKKGVVYDILNNTLLNVSSKSRLQFISTEEIVNTILYILSTKCYNIDLDVFSSKNISMNEIERILNKKAKYLLDKLPLEYYNIQPTNMGKIFKYKSSRYYIKEYIKECKM
jgi:nucleoside-diphosphate-sugar epimerase